MSRSDPEESCPSQSLGARWQIKACPTHTRHDGGGTSSKLGMAACLENPGALQDVLSKRCCPPLES